MYIEHLRIPVGAGAVHVERVGRGGPPVALLHGFGTSAFLWRAVAPLLANAGFTALSLDLLGYGESDRPQDAGYGIFAQAEYVDRVLTALRLPKAVIVGQDIGALVALQLAARRPERVDRLLLISPPDPGDLPSPAVRSLQRAAARIVLGAPGLFGAGQVLAPLLRESVANPAHMPDLLVARYMAPYLGTDGISHLLLLARSLELEAEDPIQVSSVRAPALIVYGELDPLAKHGVALAIASDLANSGQEARVQSVPDSGMLVPEDEPAALATLIGDWVNVLADEAVESVSQADESPSQL